MAFEVPVEGGKSTTEDPKVKKAVEGLNTLVGAANLVKGAGIEEGTIEGKNIKAATVEDSDLASPNNGAYRPLFRALTIMKAGLVAGTYPLDNSKGNPVASGTDLLSTERTLPQHQFTAADYEVAGKTQKLRLRAQVSVNATKAAIKFTFGLYPITVAGGGTELKFTLGTVVASSTVEINEPAASTITSAVNSDFTIPSNGSYCLGVVTSGTLTASSNVELSAQLQTRSV